MKWTDRSRLATAIVVVVVGIGCVCLINGVRRVGRTEPGFLLAENRIVVSIAPPGWSLQRAARILFAQVVAIEGRPISTAAEVQRHVSTLPIGTPVTYRFRSRADVFTEAVPVRRFGWSDFFAVYATYFFVGICFAGAGLFTIRRAGHAPAANSFFVLSLVGAVVLLTGGDVYGPYWFTDLYFTAHCLTPAAIFHFTCSYPESLGYGSTWRRLILALPYMFSLAMAVTLDVVADDPSLFLPIVYTVWLLTANAGLLYLGRLAIAVWSTTDAAARLSLRHALAGFLLSQLVPGVIFVIYPAIKGPVSPVALVAPMALFPLFTAAAVRRAAAGVSVVPGTSVRLRLSFLFLGAVQTAFLIGVAVFWLSNSWSQSFDDLTINQRQQMRIERFLGRAAGEDAGELWAIDELVQSIAERQFVIAATTAMEQADLPAARQAIEHLRGFYQQAATRLELRRQWIDRLGAVLVAGLVIAGVVQAVAFMIAIRRWLILPINTVADATSVIATGDLAHRLEIDSADEFAALGRAVNAMAASLEEIQRQVAAEQAARQQAAGAARDAERRRLARELHDGVLQDLAVAKLQLESERKRTPNATLTPSIEALITVITDLRRVVDDLRPPDLSHDSLADAIAAHARVLTQARHIDLDLDLADASSVPEWAARDVYRIAQEAIANAVRHAAPSRLRVHLHQQTGQSTLEVADNGAGFDLDTVTLGTGIAGMRERAAALGATLTITTRPGHGTAVQLTVPPRARN